MTKEEIKAMLEDSGVVFTDENVDKIESKLGKTIPYDRFKEKVDAFNSLKEENDKTAKRLSQLSTKNLELEEGYKELSTYKEKFEQYEKLEQERTQAENNKILETYNAKIKLFDVKEGDSRFEKIAKAKSRLVMPEEGKELSIDQVKANMGTIELLEDMGVFEAQKGNDVPAPPPATTQFNNVPMSPVVAFANKNK